MGWLHDDDYEPATADKPRIDKRVVGLCGPRRSIDTVTKIVHNGKEMSGNDGFIVQGCVFASHVGDDGKPGGGLIGDPEAAGKLESADVPYYIFDKSEMLSALGYTVKDLRKILYEWEPHTRGCEGIGGDPERGKALGRL